MSKANRRIALVTGGTRGIGLGIARALAREGWALVLGGTRPEHEVAGVIEELKALESDRISGEASAREVNYVRGDLAERRERAHFVDQVRARFGTVNALVNNAGRAPRVRLDLLDATEESFEEVLRTNLHGPYFLTQALARDQVARRRDDPSFQAAIVFVTSVSAEMASTNRGEYCVSKAGLSMAARLFAARLAGDGVPVYEVRPGIVATDMTAAVRDVYDRRIAEGLIPDGRWGEPDDVGRAVAALVRGDLPYATGTVVHVDGGLTVPRL